MFITALTKGLENVKGLSIKKTTAWYNDTFRNLIGFLKTSFNGHIDNDLQQQLTDLAAPSFDVDAEAQIAQISRKAVLGLAVNDNTRLLLPKDKVTSW